MFTKTKWLLVDPITGKTRLKLLYANEGAITPTS